MIRNRLTFKNLWQHFWADIWGLDNTFFKTIKDMVRNPKSVCLGYINGVRKKYVSPFTFLAIITTISSLLFIQLSDTMNAQLAAQNETMYEGFQSMAKGNKEMVEAFRKQQEASTEATAFINKYYSLFIFLSIPMYSLLSFFTFRKKFNFIEHLVINSYIMAMVMIGGIFISLFSIVSGQNLSILNFIITIVLYIYVYHQILGTSHFQILKYSVRFVVILLFVFLIIGLLGFIAKPLAYFVGKLLAHFFK